MEGISIREATEADAGALHQFMVGLVSEQLPTIHHRSKAPSIEEERQFLCHLRSNGVGLIALAGAAVVGFLDFHTKSGRFGMSVARDHRNQGIGTALINALIGWATQSSLAKLELEVFENNQGAVRLYQRLGFGITNRQRGAAVSAGRSIDTLLMSRELGGKVARK